MNVCIFCSANELDEVYTKPAKELARTIAENGHTVVWGGSNYGLMKDIADSAQQAGGKLIGISTEFFKKYARPDADEMVFAKNLGERKAMLLARSDVIIVLVGGLGTLDEVSEILELKKEGQHNKPVIILNTNGFYDGLKTQLQRIADEGFLPVREQEGIAMLPLSELVTFVDEPSQVMDHIDTTARTPSLQPTH